MTPEPNPPLVVLTFAERIVAVNARTGDRVWEFATGINALRAGPRRSGSRLAPRQGNSLLPALREGDPALEGERAAKHGGAMAAPGVSSPVDRRAG